MGAVSVITIPLKTEKWQEDVLFKRFETYRSIYNAMLGGCLKTYRKMLRDERYVKSIEVIHSAYKESDEKKKKEIKKSDEYKAATATQKDLLKEYGFSEFAFISLSLQYAKHFSNVTSTNVVGLSVGKPMWSGFNKMLFGNGKIVHFKKYNTWSSIVSNGKSGIRIIGSDGKTTIEMDSKEQYFCLLSTKAGKKLKMPLKVCKKDLFMLEMMERKIHQVRIVREKVNGKFKYCVQLTIEGEPAIKYKTDSSRLHDIGEGRVGLYIDTKYVVVTTAEETKTLDISFQNDVSEEISELQNLMENSRRAKNPDNYNEDGTIKKGIFKDGQRRPLYWIYSNTYMKYKAQLSDIYRKQAKQRKIRANIIANEILSLGNDIIVNDYPFQAAAMRKKEDKLKADGTPASKARAGKRIGENAPAMIVSIIDQKLKSNGYDGVTKKKIKVDHNLAEYRKFYSSELYRA